MKYNVSPCPTNIVTYHHVLVVRYPIYVMHNETVTKHQGQNINHQVVQVSRPQLSTSLEITDLVYLFTAIGAQVGLTSQKLR